MPRGSILELKNNYGIIDTDAYKVEHEWIPFRIEKSMLEEKEGKQYIKYTDEVEFSLSRSQGVRDRDIKEASKEEDIRQQMSGVYLCSLRLSDMGNTTLGITAPPHDEIAQEAFSVWELFEGKY